MAMNNPIPTSVASFSPQQRLAVLQNVGYTGPIDEESMEKFSRATPGAASLVLKLQKKAMEMKGQATGAVTSGLAEGGAVSDTGNLFKGTLTTPISSNLVPQEDQDVADDNVVEADTIAETSQVGTTATATAPTQLPANTFTAGTSTEEVVAANADLKPAEGKVSDKAVVGAAQQTTSAVSDLTEAQGAAIVMANPVQRQIQDGELISSVANAEKASKFTEEIQAAEATPTVKATVQGQLSDLMTDFEGGATPSWASGAIRAASASMASRGLSASSIAGQALVQAAMESTLPIAMADAQTQASFETQNLSNRQQRAMLGAQQRAKFMGQEFDQAFQSRVQNASRISDIANMNFTAEQQIALENSRNANTVNLSNLSNRQAMVMSEASALSNLDMANLSNRQQSAVQNAQAFLQVDMTNLSNKQQADMFKAQARQQSILTDTAAANASKQFNATSENQTNQFFADLSANVSKFNSDQMNGISKFNTGALNATEQFNTAQNNSFRQFNTSNSLIIAQANAAWRQNMATVNNATANANALYVAKEKNGLSTAALDEIWQRERDIIDYAFNAYESQELRSNAIVLEQLTVDGTKDAAILKAELESESATTQWLLSKLF